MKASNYKVEYKMGDVQMCASNVLVHDIDDMETVEYWEDRLIRLKQPFTVAYRKLNGMIVYSIFTDLRKKVSVFK